VPRSSHVQDALTSLHAGNLEAATAAITAALAEKGPQAAGSEAILAREVLLLAIEREVERTVVRERSARKVRDAGAGEITLLDLRLQRLRFAYQPHLAWITAGAGLLIAGTSAHSVLRFGLSPWVALLGGAAFLAGAILLIRDDHHRQHAAFTARRTQIVAEVAEEKQILAAEVRAQETEMAGALRERERLLLIAAGLR
jgi:hypothetical protein